MCKTGLGVATLGKFANLGAGGAQVDTSCFASDLLRSYQETRGIRSEATIERHLTRQRLASVASLFTALEVYGHRSRIRISSFNYSV